MLRILFLVFIFSSNCLGQIKITPRPIGKFLTDTIRLGEIVNFSFVYKHNSKQEVFFTDKAFDYRPFELVDKIYFPTKTINNVSVDSAIYQFRTFSIDSIQSISIPVFLANKGDSTLIYCEKDSIVLLQQIAGNLRALSVKDNSRLLPMKVKINIAYLFLQIAIIIVAIIIWWLVFGKTVMSQINIFTIYRRHVEFKKIFNRYAKSATKTNLEKALTLWKDYIGKLQKRSYTTMTTPEIIKNIPNDHLETALREIDKSIYGNIISEDINNSFTTLNNLADYYYNLQKREYSIVKKLR
ncbi:MAG: hypothetical protein V4683_02120 [Bacteroidota bacterium]